MHVDIKMLAESAELTNLPSGLPSGADAFERDVALGFLMIRSRGGCGPPEQKKSPVLLTNIRPQ